MRRESIKDKFNRAATCKEFACREAGIAALEVDESSTMQEKNKNLAQGLSPRNNGKLRDRTSEYRETCIKSLGTVLNYRCGGSVAVWPPTDKTPR